MMNISICWENFILILSHSLSHSLFVCCVLISERPKYQNNNRIQKMRSVKTGELSVVAWKIVYTIVLRSLNILTNELITIIYRYYCDFRYYRCILFRRTVRTILGRQCAKASKQIGNHESILAKKTHEILQKEKFENAIRFYCVGLFQVGSFLVTPTN